MNNGNIVCKAILMAIVLVLSGCGSSKREVVVDWPEGGQGGSGTDIEETMPEDDTLPGPDVTQPWPEGTGQEFTTAGGTEEISLNGEYKAYNMYEVTDPTFSNMVAYRTLMPQGWTANGGVDWSCNSAVTPAQIWVQAISPDGAASINYVSDQWYAMQYTMGSPVQAWGYPQREPVSAEQAAMEMMDKLTVSGVQFTSSINADAEGAEWNQLAPMVEQMRQELSAYQQELQNPYLTHTIFEGTGSLNGQAYDVRVEAAVFGYRSYSDYVVVDYCSVTGVNVLLAPQGQMSQYIADMLEIQSNSSINQNWLMGMNQVSAQIWAVLRERQDTEWAAARQMSAQLSAQVDAIIDHTNSWIANTDSRMDARSEQWEDYMFDQTDYATGDGGSITVSDSWEHVWMGDDGSVYVSNQSDLFDNPNTNPNLTTGYTELEALD